VGVAKKTQKSNFSKMLSTHINYSFS